MGFVRNICLIASFVLSVMCFDESIPLYGNATLGYYYVVVKVGNPPQEQALIVDTGSFSTIFGCKGCKNCNDHQNRIFKPANSSTFYKIRSNNTEADWKCDVGKGPRANLCRFSEGYFEGSSYQGYWASDSFSFTEDIPTNEMKHTFGCAMSEKEEFYSQGANGIMGLGLEDAKKKKPLSIIRSVLGTDSDQAKFSICIGGNGGRMRFKKPNFDLHLPNAHLSTIKYDTRNWNVLYTAALSGIRIAEQPLSYGFKTLFKNNQDAFFDTGTTFTYFPEKLFAEWKRVFNNFCKKNSQNCGGFDELQECYDMSKKTDLENIITTFPNVVFTFNDKIDYNWNPKDYMIETQNYLCVGVKSLHKIILGAVFMRNYDITFDISKSEISFVRADCQKLQDSIKVFH